MWTTQQQLPDTLRTALRESCRPELIGVLREDLPSLGSTLTEQYQEVHSTSHDKLVTKLAEHYQEVSSGIEEIKRQMINSRTMQRQTESPL